jgi:hypothetical protein
MFTDGEYQSSNYWLNSLGQIINPYPGYAIWFIAAAKNSKLIKDWKENYFNFTIMGF